MPQDLRTSWMLSRKAYYWWINTAGNSIHVCDHLTYQSYSCLQPLKDENTNIFIKILGNRYLTLYNSRQQGQHCHLHLCMLLLSKSYLASSYKGCFFMKLYVKRDHGNFLNNQTINFAENCVTTNWAICKTFWHVCIYMCVYIHPGWLWAGNTVISMDIKRLAHEKH